MSPFQGSACCVAAVFAVTETMWYIVSTYGNNLMAVAFAAFLDAMFCRDAPSCPRHKAYGKRQSRAGASALSCLSHVGGCVFPVYSDAPRCVPTSRLITVIPGIGNVCGDVCCLCFRMVNGVYGLKCYAFGGYWICSICKRVLITR